MEARTPPQNLEAEASVLASMMLDQSTIDPVSAELTAESFYKEGHRKIYNAILKVHRNGDPVDLVAINEALRVSGQLESVGGPMYLLGLVENLTTAAYTDYYTRVVREKQNLRDYIKKNERVMQAAYDEQDPGEVAALDQRLSLELSKRTSRSQWADGQGIADATLGAFEESLKRIAQGLSPGLSTGLEEMDNITSGGLQKEGLYIVGARPSVGKTALGLTIGYNVARNGYNVGAFSHEMSKTIIGARLVAIHKRLDITKIINPRNLSPSLEKQIRLGFQEVAGLPFYMDDNSEMTVDQLYARARELHLKVGLSVVIVDYLQLISSGIAQHRGNRTAEVGYIALRLKHLARELGVPVIALSQLNRGVEGRADKMPTMADLRESGDIENHADGIFLIHREDYYDKFASNAGVATIICAKNRNGPTGVFELRYSATATRFDNLDPRY